MARDVDLYVSGFERIHRRICKGEVGPSGEVIPGSLNFHVSVARDVHDPGGAILSADPKRDGVASALVGRVVGLTAGPILTEVIDSPTPVDPAHAMVVVMSNERQASGDNVRLIRKKIAAAFAVTKSPTK